MKNLILSAIALFAFVSCNKDEGIVVTPNDGEVTFTSGIATRASGQTWANGDAIGVFMTQNGTLLNENVKYTTTSTLMQADFTSDNPIYYPQDGDVNFLAYYPWNSSTTDAKIYPIDVTNQTDLPTIDLMIATATGSKATESKSLDLMFTHKLSNIIINVVLGDGVAQSVLANLKVELIGTLSAKGTYDLSADDNKISITETASSITLPKKVSDVTKLIHEGIVIPQTIAANSLKLRFTTDEYGSFETSLSTTAFEENKQYTYKATMYRTKVVLSGSTISLWGEGGGEDDLTAGVSPPKIGDYYYNDETYSTDIITAKTVIGVVFYIEPTNKFSGKIVSLDEPTAGWYNSNKVGFLAWSEVDEVTNAQDFIDGCANMKTVWEFAGSAGSNNFDNYPAFKWVHAKNPDGTTYTEGQKRVWYLPATLELQQLYAGMSGLQWIKKGEIANAGEVVEWELYHKMPNDVNYTTQRSEFNEKVGTKITYNWYWASTEHQDAIYSSSFAWGMNFSGGNTTNAGAKKNVTENLVRAIRAF